MSETAFATEILQWAKVYKWRAFHVRNSGYGGQTYVQGDKGFPDLFLIKGQRIVVAELKVGKKGTLKGDPTAEQAAWLKVLGALGSELWRPIETYVWRPADLPDILRVLSGSS